MRILDRYITSRFTGNLIFSLIAFICIFVIVDLIEHLSDFIDKQVPPLIVTAYYFYYLPFIIVLTMPIAMLLASMFAIGQLSKHHELAAMQSSGISLYRIVAPLLAIGLLVSAGIWFFGEKVMTVGNQRKAEINQIYIQRLPRSLPSRLANLYLQESANRRIFIGYFNARSNTANKISIQTYDSIFVVSRLDAAHMQWTGGRWELSNGYRREFRADGEIAEKFEAMILDDLSFTPQVLAKVQKAPEEMSFAELEEFIAEVARNGGDPARWEVDLYLKISFPLANFIIVLFGAPLAAGRARSGGAVGIALSLIICFLYFGTVKTGQSMGQNGTLHPLVGAWAANVLFLIGGVVILIKAKK
jgi:lipopolysaccharide export system permease protein